MTKDDQNDQKPPPPPPPPKRYIKEDAPLRPDNREKEK
jgi:hypothetical protein